MILLKDYLAETRLLNYSHPSIKKTIESMEINNASSYEKISTLYNFVRDTIAFGYNIDDSIPASAVLSDGYGQCNTKGILFMALLRAVDIPCRIHGFAIDKSLQKGAMTGIVYRNAPDEIIHSWIEVYHNDIWYNLEGIILDREYLSKLQSKFSNCSGSFCGFGVASDDFKNPRIDWNENSTYIQKGGIVRDYGIFISPDEFFDTYSQPLSAIKRFLFRYYGRRKMNKNIARIRGN